MRYTNAITSKIFIETEGQRQTRHGERLINEIECSLVIHRKKMTRKITVDSSRMFSREAETMYEQNKQTNKQSYYFV